MGASRLHPVGDLLLDKLKITRSVQRFTWRLVRWVALAAAGDPAAMESKDERWYTPRQSSARGSSEESAWFSPRSSARSNSGHNSARSDSGDDAKHAWHTPREGAYASGGGARPSLWEQRQPEAKGRGDDRGGSDDRGSYGVDGLARPGAAEAKPGPAYAPAPPAPEPHPEYDADVDNIFSFARHNRVDDVERLLLRGVPPNVRDVYGNTVTLVAAQNGHKRIVKGALRRGADINAANYRGNTALHFCFSFGFDKLGDYMISKGADPGIRNNAGLSCYEGLG